MGWHALSAIRQGLSAVRDLNIVAFVVVAERGAMVTGPSLAGAAPSSPSTGSVCGVADCAVPGADQVGDLLVEVAQRLGPRPLSEDPGYWLVASDGGIFTYGDAAFYGSTGGDRTLEQAHCRHGGHARRRPGYWLVASRRRCLFDAVWNLCIGLGLVNRPSTGRSWAWRGRARAAATGSWPPTAASSPTGTHEFYGSTGSIHLNRPIVGMAPTPDGGGYWLVASDGGIFATGTRVFYGSTGAIHLNQPIVGMAPTSDGGVATGSWPPTAASSPTATRRSTARRGGRSTSIRPIVGMAAAPDGEGYWMVASDGGIFSYGDAPFYGSTGGIAAQQAHRRHGVLGGSECGHLSRLLPRYSTSPSHGCHSEPAGAGPRESCTTIVCELRAGTAALYLGAHFRQPSRRVDAQLVWEHLGDADRDSARRTSHVTVTDDTGATASACVKHRRRGEHADDRRDPRRGRLSVASDGLNDFCALLTSGGVGLPVGFGGAAGAR